MSNVAPHAALIAHRPRAARGRLDRDGERRRSPTRARSTRSDVHLRVGRRDADDDRRRSTGSSCSAHAHVLRRYGSYHVTVTVVDKDGGDRARHADRRTIDGPPVVTVSATRAATRARRSRSPATVDRSGRAGRAHVRVDVRLRARASTPGATCTFANPAAARTDRQVHRRRRRGRSRSTAERRRSTRRSSASGTLTVANVAPTRDDHRARRRDTLVRPAAVTLLGDRSPTRARTTSLSCSIDWGDGIGRVRSSQSPAAPARRRTRTRRR